ncbi:MAG: hypothetical protein RJA09_446 [Pseudomonadota bacterium]
MKVLDLGCTQGHTFEGWFGSETDFQNQLGRGLVTCPVCGDAVVSKRLSAPRLNLGAPVPQSEPAPAAAASSTAPTTDQPAMAQALKALRAWVQKTEDVGPRFAEEARRMHHGEAPTREIRGQATLADAAALVEEGIPVMPLPDVPALKETLQ